MSDFSIKSRPSIRPFDGSAKNSLTDALPKKPPSFTRSASVDSGFLTNAGHSVAKVTRRLFGREDPALKQANADVRWWKEQAMRLQASIAPPLAASPSMASSYASELSQLQRSPGWASPYTPTPSSTSQSPMSQSSMSPSPMVSPVVFGTQAQAQARAHANVNGHAPEEILRQWRMANSGQWHMAPNNNAVIQTYF